MSVDVLVARITSAIINPLIALIFAAGFLLFVWGVVQFLFGLAQGGEANSEGKMHMFWGIMGMAIMIGAYGIVRIIINTFGL